MYGYQPPAARRLAPTPEQYADGGLVARMKSADAGPAAFGARGLSQLRDLVPKMAAMGYSQQAAAPAPAPAPVSDQRVAQLQAMIPQMEAMGYQKRPLTPQMLARGGMVRGPGTGTSDSIPDEAEPGTYIMPADSTAAIGPDALEKMGTVPVRLSDGEMKIPPEQVMAIGAAVLKLLKDTTHTPVNGVDGGQTDAEVEDDDDDEKGARGFNPADRMAQMPEQMYADGGMVEDDVTRVGNSYSGGNVGGNITVNGAAPGGTFSMGSPIRSAAPAPQAAALTNPAPSNPAATPAASATPAAAPPAPMGWAERNAQRNLQVTASSIMDSPERRMAQAALAPPPPPAPAAAPAPAQPVAGFQPAAQRMGTVPPVGQPSLGYQPRRFADGGMVEDDLQKRLMQIPTGGMQAPQPDGSQNSPLNTEIGRNAMNTLSALPGAGGLASRGGATAARAATGGALSTERVLPAAWEVVQEGGSLVNRAGTATQQMGQIGNATGGALTRAASMSQGAPQAALSGPGGQLATRAAGEVGEAAAGFAPRARAATQWADVVEPAALGAPTVGQGAVAVGQAAPSAARGFGRYAAGAAGLGGAALVAGSAGDSGASQATPNMPPSQPFAQTAGTPQTSAAAQSPAAAALGQMPATQNAITRTGNSYTGPANISGDVLINGAAPGGGQISAQNMAAADSLAGRQAQESLARVLGQMPAPQQTNVQAPTVRHSGNDWAARNALRNAEVSASSIMNNGGRWDRTGGRNPAALAYQQALATDNALQASEPGLAAAAMKENSETNRSAMRERGLAAQALASERGAMDRTLITERGANARTGLTTQATLDAAKIKAQQEMAEQQRKAALKNPETSTALRKEFEGLPEVKNYKQALPAYKGIEDAVKRNTPMSDINIVYGIAKLYDPNSVVREGEYATVANAPNIPERVKGWVQYATNGGKLTPEVKKQIMDEASSRMMSFQNEFEGSSARYRDIAERSNADPTLVISSDYKPAVSKKEDQAAAAVTVPDSAVAHLRGNPALAAQFDAKYGAGAASRYLTK